MANQDTLIECDRMRFSFWHSPPLDTHNSCIGVEFLNLIPEDAFILLVKKCHQYLI